MIDISLLLAFIAAATVLAITPGVDTAIVLNTALSNGKRDGMMAGLGVGAGCLFWGIAAALGLGVVIQASESAYAILKYLGALYLLWLGVGLIARPRSTIACDSPSPGHRRSSASFTKGFTVNLLNPKVGLFYVTFLPQFVPAGADVVTYSFALAGIHVLLSLLWFAALIAATLPLGRFIKQPATIKTLDRITGSIFVLFAARLAS